MSEAPLEARPESAAARSRGSSFYGPMRILPRPRREAMFEIYAFCRAVDDIADEGGPREARLAALGKWRRDLAALYAGDPIPEHMRGLKAAITAFSLKQEDFLAIVDGMEMDARADIQAPDLATLDLYCDHVASAVGRLSVRVFDVPANEGPGLAHHLGRAFQLTNILRDLDEDAAIGRLYLPRETLLAAGIEETSPKAVMAHPNLPQACAPVLAMAEEHFRESRAIMARCPRQSVRAPCFMADVYEAIHEGLRRSGFTPPRKRIKAPRHKILLALLRHGLF
jgi:squalene synthase HpnD